MTTSADLIASRSKALILPYNEWDWDAEPGNIMVSKL